MHRRFLIKLCLALPGLTPVISRALSWPGSDPDMIYPVQDCGLRDNAIFTLRLDAAEYEWPCLCVGDVLDLRRDHDNTGKPNKGSLYLYGTARIDACVSLPDNTSITRLLDAGVAFQCRVIEKTGALREIPGILFSVYPAGAGGTGPRPAAGPATPGRRDAYQPVINREYTVGGFRYHGGEYYWNELAAGDRLDLRRDRCYPQDPQAVAVYWDEDLMIGYIPRPDNAAIARLLDDGVPMLCRIAGKTELPGYDHGIRIAVKTANTINAREPWTTSVTNY